MKKREGKNILFIFGIIVFLLLGMLIFAENFYLPITGMVTSTATATMTEAGASGIAIVDSNIVFGAGYYNATCVGNSYAVLDSNLTYGDGTAGSVYGPASPYCWVNTTAILSGTGRDHHTIQNNGTVIVNISAIANGHGEDLFCGGNCPFTNVARVEYLSYDNESYSCQSLSSGYEAGITFNSNVTIGICDRLDYEDVSDTINVFVNVSIPKDSTTGAKTITVTYEAIAY